MNEEIKKYIGAVYDEIKITTLSDYNLTSYKTPSKFDDINFHLLNKHILDNSDVDFFIGIPEEDYRENFFETVFYGVTLVKLFQNYCSYTKDVPQLKSGDIIYTNKRIYEYLGGSYGMMNLKLKFPAPNERNSIIQKNKGIFTKLNNDFDFKKRRTVECLEGYNDFLKNTFKDNRFPLMTEFIHKSLIISDKKLTQVNENIPFRYHSRNGVDKHNIPVDTLIEVCNSFTVAKNLIDEGKITNDFDEVIIIGDAKYRDASFPEIQNAKWRGYFKSIVLIGTDKPNTENPFNEWNWTKREIIIAHNQVPNCINSIIVNNGELTNAITSFHNFLEQKNNSLQIDISYLLKFTNFFLRQVISGETVTDAYEHYIQRVQNHLEDKEFESLLLPAVNYSQSQKKEIITEIFQHFLQIKNLCSTSNAKWDLIVSIAKEKKLFLLVDKRQASPLKLFLKANDIKNIKLVTNKKVPDALLLNDFIRDENLNTKDKLFLVSYLSDPKLYNELMEIKGEVRVLCYDQLDVQIFKNLKAKEENTLAKHISHSDRKIYVSEEFKMQEIPIIQTKFFKDAFEFKEPITIRHYNTDGEPSSEGVWYELKFSDGTDDILMASKKVLWKLDGQRTEVEIEECGAGFEISYYRNSDKNAFQSLLKLKDEKAILDEVGIKSMVWKNALKSLQLQFKSIKRVYREVMNGKNLVSEKTFENYFDKDCATMFPSDEILQAIFDCFKRHKYSGNSFMTNYDGILKAAALHKSVSIKFGHYLSGLLSGDFTTDISAVISEANALPVEIRDKILSFIKIGTITSKKILSRDDKRIPIQPEFNI